MSWASLPAVAENILCLFKGPGLASFIMLHHLGASRHEHWFKSPKVRGKNHPVSTCAAIRSEGVTLRGQMAHVVQTWLEDQQFPEKWSHCELGETPKRC